MLTELQMIGVVIGAVIVVASFAAVIIKITNKIDEPISELKLVIQQLKDALDVITGDVANIRRRVDAHGKEIDEIKIAIMELKTKIKMYHEKQGG